MANSEYLFLILIGFFFFLRQRDANAFIYPHSKANINEMCAYLSSRYSHFNNAVTTGKFLKIEQSAEFLC